MKFRADKIAQKVIDDRGQLFEGVGPYTTETIREALDLAESWPVQYIQYNWDNARGEVTQFYSYTPQEWDTFNLLPNLQSCKVYGRSISGQDLEDYIKDRVQPEGAAIQ